MPSPDQEVSESVEIAASSDVVFTYVDDIRNVGMHMTERSSMPMMGSKLRLEVLPGPQTGEGATYRYSGTVMGFSVDFTERVTRYVPGREKVWRTTGNPKLVIIGSYEMRIVVEPRPAHRARLRISIAYVLPRTRIWRIVGTVFAGPYSRWCLRRMCEDAKRALEPGATA